MRQPTFFAACGKLRLRYDLAVPEGPQISDDSSSADIDDLKDVKVGTMLGRFRLDERIGAGGMGIVYKGIDTDTQKPVAVKFLHEAFAGIADFVKRFQREVQAMRKLSAHPHLVAILDAGISGGVPYLVMEFLSGKSLAELVERGAIKTARAVQIIQQILEGVGHAHQSGVVHRDLKPDNILLADGDAVKILDFGLAKMAAEGATQLTTTGLALGTPGYMSPEQARGSPADERADLYSVGVILYHLVVGQKPFVADSAMAVMRMHMEEPPTSPRKAAPEARISSALDAAILRALEKEPAKRWATAEAFAAALGATPEGGGSLDDAAFDKTAIGRKATPSSPKNRSIIVRRPRSFLGLAVLLIIVGGGLYAWNYVRTSRPAQKQMSQELDRAMSSAKRALDSLTAPDAPKTGPIKADGQAVTKTGAEKSDVAKTTGDKPDTAAKTPDKPVAKSDKPDDETDDNDDTPPAPPSNTPGIQLEASTKPASNQRQLTLADATRLLNANKVDEAMQALFQLRQRSPKSSAIALYLGHSYFRKNWRHDGLREYNEAIALSQTARKNQLLVHNVVQALDDPTYKSARALLRGRLGNTALSELHKAAKSDDDPTVRRRASRVAEQMRGPQKSSGKRKHHR